MKILKYIIIFVVALVVFYIGAILLGFDLPKPAFLDKGIAGSAELKVTLLMDNNVKNPLSNVEVDVGIRPGDLPKGGMAVTGETGTATFKIKPGTYYIFFNENAFPKNLKIPEPKQVNVVAGSGSQETFYITTAR